jgi:hypothetical protein
VCDATLQRHEPGADDTVEAIVAADRRAREVAQVLVRHLHDARHDTTQHDTNSHDTQQPMMGITA